MPDPLPRVAVSSGKLEATASSRLRGAGVPGNEARKLFPPYPVGLLGQLANLREGTDYLPGDATKQPRLTEAGEGRIHSDEFPVPWNDLRRPWKRYVENALSARLRFHRDVHYVVQEGKVVIVDEFTGRARAESSWKDGLHQAVEAKEGLEIQAESQSAAGIARQRFYRLYENLCGMTGTALDAAGEFWEVFRMPVVTIPRHRPNQAKNLATRVFVSEAAKIRANADELSRAKAEHEIALADLQLAREAAFEAEAEARQIEAQIETRTLRAPFDGVVARIHRENSASVSPQEGPIVSLVSLGELDLVVHIDHRRLDGLAAGLEIPVQALDRPVSGTATIAFVSPVVDASSGTARLRLTLPNSGGEHLSGVKYRIDLPKP